jgi:hypothetical protein
MTDNEIWMITDLHVESGAGISVRDMAELSGLQLLSQRSYGFFGRMWSELPQLLRSEEEQLCRQHCLNGWAVAAAWGK